MHVRGRKDVLGELKNVKRKISCVRNVETDANVNVCNMYSESYIDTTDQGSHNCSIYIYIEVAAAANCIVDHMRMTQTASWPTNDY